MDHATTKEILGLLADMKREAVSPRMRGLSDDMAVGLITQDCRPLVMADNLGHWLGLSTVASQINSQVR